MSPAYPYDSSANGGLSYTFTFDDTSGDGIRIYGVPVQVNGFNFAFTTIIENYSTIACYYSNILCS